MRYEIKKYSKDEFLVIQDPYTGTNLTAVNLSKFEEKDLFILNILTFFPFYDFLNSMEYRVYVELEPEQKKSFKDDVDYLSSCFCVCLEVPETQATQLALLSLSKDKCLVKSTKSYKVAFSILHNLIAAGITARLGLKK